jgi:hypothetical protein
VLKANVRVQRHEQLTFDRPSALKALASTGYDRGTLRAVAGDATYWGSVNGRNAAQTVNSSGRHGRQQPLHSGRFALRAEDRNGSLAASRPPHVNLGKRTSVKCSRDDAFLSGGLSLTRVAETLNCVRPNK